MRPLLALIAAALVCACAGTEPEADIVPLAGEQPTATARPTEVPPTAAPTLPPAATAAQQLAATQAPTSTPPPPAPTNTPVPVPTATQPPPPPPPPPTPTTSNCHPSYPTVCIPPPPPDLDCGDIGFRRFTVVGADPHRFDADKDGIGCES